MPEEDDIQNRMAETPDLDPLRASSVKPTWWERTGEPAVRALRSSTAITVVLAVAILLAIGLMFVLVG